MEMNRETWLNNLAALMAPRFAELGYPLPSFRVSIGFTSQGKSGNDIGECWNKSTSSDQHFEIFLRPDRADSMDVAATMAHELTHAAVGFACGHKGAFGVVALALGLKRPLAATTPGEPFVAWCQPFIDSLGPIPHAALTWATRRAPNAPRVGRGAASIEPASDEAGGEEGDGDFDLSTGPKPQVGRLLKALCAECGYTVRVTAKWLAVGAPRCPNHGPMEAGGD